jgi:uncharacterized membrane protein YfcA
MVETLTGTLEISAALLSLIAAILAISIFKVSHRNRELRAWKYIIVGLIFFMAGEIFGALNSFNIYQTIFLTHIIPTAILGLLITALVIEIHYVEGPDG